MFSDAQFATEILLMKSLSGFIAYPSQPIAIGSVISQALNSLKPDAAKIHLTSWQENDIAGRFLIDPILTNISISDVLVADITRLNFNVIFEIGYAIGRKKRVYLVRNDALTGSDTLIREVGIFDTLGYNQYSNSDELATLLRAIVDVKPLSFDANQINTSAPVYLVLPRKKTDLEIRLVSRIKKARLQFRSFDAEELGRLAAGEAIENVAKSHGIVLPLLSKERIDFEVHNFRAAFVAGLAMALDKILLLLQEGEDPVPLDYRDLVKSFRGLDQINVYIADFATEVGARFQSTSSPIVSEPKTFLERLNLGASAAENELQDLGNYYIETDEYRRALSGEVRVVTGRKGAGKTALFAQVRNKLRQDRSRVVLDLKPEGFQLLKFREKVLDYLEEGTKEHTITAFWEYLLLLEICHKLLQKDEEFHLRDNRLYEPYRLLAQAYKEDEYVSEGDFSERMLKLTQRIADDFASSQTDRDELKYLKTGQITELLYKHNLTALRKRVIEYLKYKKGLWLLFDNLDKGWPAHGVTPEDVLTLRCLIDAMSKIERELRKHNIDCHGIVFIRNDVYELLVANTPDRGKVASITLDWTDPELMRELLRRRFLYTDTGIADNSSFDEIWRQIATTHIQGEETSHYLIDRSLMRPRALIDLVRFCRSHAVNLRHDRIEVADIEHGEEAYSNELLSNIDFEIQDVEPSAAGLLYEFIESNEVLSGTDIYNILSKAVGENKAGLMLSLLLWYGFFGVMREDGETTYIYSVKYDIKRLEAMLKKRGLENASFKINPAFWRALEIRN